MAGHIYGRLGQGKKTYFEDANFPGTKGFQWHTTIDAQHNMLVSILPQDESSVSVATNEIILKAKSVDFINPAVDLAYPVLPAATAPPDGKATMVKLSASLVALGAAGYLGLF